MNPKHTVCEGNVNWGNLAQNGINWHSYVDLLFEIRPPHKVILDRCAKFSCSEITFTQTEAVHFVHIQMGDNHKGLQPANLMSAA